jgi:O-antigen ligase
MNRADDTNNSRPPLTRLEKAALGQAGGLLVFASWAFDGNVGWARTLISWWGLAAALITLGAALRGSGRRILRWLWPLLAFDLLVLASCLNPSFSTHMLDGESLIVQNGGLSWLPGSAEPAASLRAIWLFNSVFLSGLNLALCVRQRRSLRWLLVAATVNALALSIFGTVQKLTGAGLFFGLRKSPNEFFFSTFIYHNHWGAFAVLSVATCAGLVFHYTSRHRARDFWHSPAFAGAIGLLFIAATAPLSESRSGTLLVLLLAGVMLVHTLRHWCKKSQTPVTSLAWRLGGTLAAAFVLAVAIYKLDERGFKVRAELTRQQIGEMQATGGIGSRAELYHDTWHMARDRLWFGWGFDSYARVFMLYNTQKSVDSLPVFYAQAHSDWLQIVAETGLVGTVLIGLLGALPLLTLRRHHCREPLVLYPLLGCALILLYAWVEFPFECPAVAIFFWLMLFAAVRYAQLSPADNEPS